MAGWRGSGEARCLLWMPDPSAAVIRGPALDKTKQDHGISAVMPSATADAASWRLFNSEKKIGAGLTVVPMRNWRRDAWLDSRDAVDQPVANMPPSGDISIGAFESTNISVPRHGPPSGIGALDRQVSSRGAQTLVDARFVRRFRQPPANSQAKNAPASSS